MNKINARWEWRTFGQDFGAAEARLAPFGGERAQRSEELYFLTSNPNINIKIRDNLLDIKILEQENADGLEQWRPALKAPFPLDAAAVASLRDALGATAGSLPREGMSRDQATAQLTGPGGPARAVSVVKARRRFTVGDCQAELTDLVVDGTAVRTVAVEDVDPARVIAAVRSLELAGYANTSYPRGLWEVTGLSGESTAAAVRQAILDIGTNSVKFHVAERGADGTWTPLVDRAEVTRLGEGLNETGAIAPAAIERTLQAISGMADEARRLGAGGVTAVGTMGLRSAGNSKESLDLVKARCGVEIEIISGAEESRIAYLAVISALGAAQGVVAIFDTGGGSSQFTFGRGTQVDRQFSLNVGAVRFTESYHLDQAVSPEALKRARDAVDAELSPLDSAAKPETLVGMGGAVTNLTAVMLGLARYDPDRVQGAELHRDEVERQIELYRAAPAEERRRIVGLQPKRAEVILAGACIVTAIMDKLGGSTLVVSDRGLRHGLLIDRFGGKLARN